MWRDRGWYHEELNKFWWFPESSLMSKRAEDTIAVQRPDRSAGNDSEPLGLAFHYQGNVAAWHLHVLSYMIQWAILKQ